MKKNNLIYKVNFILLESASLQQNVITQFVIFITINHLLLASECIKSILIVIPSLKTTFETNIIHLFITKTSDEIPFNLLNQNILISLSKLQFNDLAQFPYEYKITELNKESNG